MLAFVFFYQADVQYRMNRPLEAAGALRRLGHVVTAEPRQGRGEDARRITQRTFELAAIYHRVYASTFDRRYADAAKTLFEGYVSITPAAPLAEDAKQRLQSLKELMANERRQRAWATRTTGAPVCSPAREQLSAHERFLQGDPKLAGKIPGLSTSPRTAPSRR